MKTQLFKIRDRLSRDPFVKQFIVDTLHLPGNTEIIIRVDGDKVEFGIVKEDEAIN